jgi:hypothetical protein
MAYHNEERWTRCPRCGEYLAWFSADGLKGKSCKKCGGYFYGTERNPIAKRCTMGDGVIHEAWCAEAHRSYVYSLCQINPETGRTMFPVAPNHKPMPPEYEVTCMICITSRE